jgi:hypothetical protein
VISAVFAIAALLTMLARGDLITINATAVSDSLFYFCDSLVQPLAPAGLAGAVVLGSVLPTDVGRVSFTFFAVAVVAEPEVLGLPIEKLAARPRIAGSVLNWAVVFVIAEDLG